MIPDNIKEIYMLMLYEELESETSINRARFEVGILATHAKILEQK